MAVTLVRIGSSGRSTLAKGKPSLLNMVARGGDVVIRLLDHVKHVTAMVFAAELV
jgi:hypothetical protein